MKKRKIPNTASIIGVVIKNWDKEKCEEIIKEKIKSYKREDIKFNIEESSQDNYIRFKIYFESYNEIIPVVSLFNIISKELDLKLSQKIINYRENKK